MFQKQTGDQPRSARIIGLFISFYAIGEILYLLLHWINVPLSIEASEKPTFLFFAILTFAELLVMFWFGAIIVDLFPGIKIDESGITVKYLISTDHFPWDEVNEVKNAGGIFKGSKAIMLQIQGSLLFKFIKYNPYFMRGLMAMLSLEPVILLSNSLFDRETILKEIGHQVQNHLKD